MAERLRRPGEQRGLGRRLKGPLTLSLSNHLGGPVTVRPPFDKLRAERAK